MWKRFTGQQYYLLDCFRDIANILQEKGRKISWKQIGELTKSGQPRHPLYARYDFGLKNFDIDSYL